MICDSKSNNNNDIVDYSEITASTETEIDHSSSSDPSVSQSKFSHFVTKSPAINKKQGDYDIENIYRPARYNNGPNGVHQQDPYNRQFISFDEAINR